MRTYAESRGKKNKKDKKSIQDKQPAPEDEGEADGTSDNTPSRLSEKSGSELMVDDPVMEARRKLAEKAKKLKSPKKGSEEKP